MDFWNGNFDHKPQKIIVQIHKIDMFSWNNTTLHSDKTKLTIVGKEIKSTNYYNYDTILV